MGIHYLFIELSCNITKLQGAFIQKMYQFGPYKDSKMLNAFLKQSYIQKMFDSSSTLSEHHSLLHHLYNLYLIYHKD